MRGKAVIASSLHSEFCGNRKTTEITCERDEFFDKEILTVSRLQFVRLKACLPNCITPSSPKFAKPIVGLYSGLPEKPLSTERHPAIRCGGTLNFIQDVLLIHGLDYKPYGHSRRASAVKAMADGLMLAERLRCRPLHEGGGWYNRDATEGVEHEQIRVTGDDQIGMAVYGQLEKFVVCGITTRGDALSDRHQLGRGQHLDDPVTKRRDRHPRKIGTVQDSEQLLLGCSGFEKAAVAINPADDEER